MLIEIILKSFSGIRKSTVYVFYQCLSQSLPSLYLLLAILFIYFSSMILSTIYRVRYVYNFKHDLYLNIHRQLGPSPKLCIFFYEVA